MLRSRLSGFRDVLVGLNVPTALSAYRYNHLKEGMVLDHFVMTVKHGFGSIDCGVMLFLLRLVGFADAGKLFPAVSQCETPQPKKDLSRYERVTAGGMA